MYEKKCTDVNNYRPISLLTVFSKIIKKLMVVRLTTYLELHEIIYPNQFGFRQGYSTSHSLISITETIKKTLDNKYGCGVFIDLRKAFDMVNNGILLQKLEHYKSYLTNGRQYVHLNGITSETKKLPVVYHKVVCWVLYYFYSINDLPNISKKTEVLSLCCRH